VGGPGPCLPPSPKSGTVCVCNDVCYPVTLSSFVSLFVRDTFSIDGTFCCCCHYYHRRHCRRRRRRRHASIKCAGLIARYEDIVCTRFVVRSRNLIQLWSCMFSIFSFIYFNGNRKIEKKPFHLLS